MSFFQARQAWREADQLANAVTREFAHRMRSGEAVPLHELAELQHLRDDAALKFRKMLAAAGEVALPKNTIHIAGVRVLTRAPVMGRHASSIVHDHNRTR